MMAVMRIVEWLKKWTSGRRPVTERPYPIALRHHQYAHQLLAEQIRQADRFYADQDYAKAFPILLQAVQSAPNFLDIAPYLCEPSFQPGEGLQGAQYAQDIEAACQSLWTCSEVLEKRPDTAETTWVLALIHVKAPACYAQIQAALAQEEEDAYTSPFGYGLYERACEKIGDLDPEELPAAELDEIVALMSKALDKEMSDPMRAKVYRAWGELELSRDNLLMASQCYENALSYNPKVGVKRKLATVQAKLQASG